MQQNNSQDRINLWILWVLASMAGILLGFALSYLIVAIAKLLFSGVNEDRLFGGVMWTALALMLTTVQWLVLRRHFTESGWWFAATMAGWLASVLSILVIGKLLTVRWGFAIQPSPAARSD